MKIRHLTVSFDLVIIIQWEKCLFSRPPIFDGWVKVIFIFRLNEWTKYIYVYRKQRIDITFWKYLIVRAIGWRKRFNAFIPSNGFIHFSIHLTLSFIIQNSVDSIGVSVFISDNIWQVKTHSDDIHSFQTFFCWWRVL